MRALRRAPAPSTAAQPFADRRDLLKDILHAAVHGINFRKTMRWGDVEQAFARPVQWVVALLGNEVLPVVLGDVTSGRTTYGHRFLAPGAIEREVQRRFSERSAFAFCYLDLDNLKAYQDYYGYVKADGVIRADVCSQCHPFYTGKQKILDTGGRVARFEARYAKKQG